MGARFFNLLAVMVVLVVAGCTDKTAETGSVTTDGLNSTDTTTMTDPTSMGDPSGVTPGSSQDFVVNVGDRVFFGYDQYDLTSEARSTVERQAQWLKQYPNTTMTVEGHCDERGTREYNLALGEKRAMTVRNYLIANGIAPNRVQTISYGKERPAVLGSDDTSWAQNRRSVVVVQ